MKLLVRTIVVSLLIFVAYIMISLARNASDQIEFNGRRYPSIEAARHAAGRLTGAEKGLQAIVADDIPFYCGHRLTVLTLVLGFYGPYDPVICFATEAESDQLYAKNRALEARYKQLAERFLPYVGYVGLAVVSAALFRAFRKSKR